MCPHVATDNCACRKPNPTLLLQAAKDYNVDLKQSWMVGDHGSDVEAGLRAGTRSILVKTANKPEDSADATYSAKSLLDAIQYIAKQQQ